MPKRQKVRFALDRDYTTMLRKMMAYDGWKGSPSSYCAYQIRRGLAFDVADLGSPSEREVKVSARLLARANSDIEEMER